MRILAAVLLIGLASAAWAEKIYFITLSPTRNRNPMRTLIITSVIALELFRAAPVIASEKEKSKYEYNVEEVFKELDPDYLTKAEANYLIANEVLAHGRVIKEFKNVLVAGRHDEPKVMDVIYVIYYEGQIWGCHVRIHASNSTESATRRSVNNISYDCKPY